jgi:hypothetical protein
MEYPRWIYGENNAAKIVFTETEHNAQIGNWYLTPTLRDNAAKGIIEPVVAEIATSEDTTESDVDPRIALWEYAAEKGIKILKTWKLENLQKAIAEAEQE